MLTADAVEKYLSENDMPLLVMDGGTCPYHYQGLPGRVEYCDSHEAMGPTAAT